MAKRGSSDYSLIIGVNKPKGMSSHDVVNRVRTIFGERRVGHMGTLDPAASGVLPVCIGPATRLDAYLVGHAKRYRAYIQFGCETNTGDAEGEVIATGTPASKLFDEGFAGVFTASLVGEHTQTPPAYSAIKINGKTAYKLAREGKDVELPARTISVYEASLVGVEISNETGLPSWIIDVFVSKGTYIRSLAVDIGRAVGCPAHLSGLERTSVGIIKLEDCVTLEALEELQEKAALDVIDILGYRCAFIKDAEKISNGKFLDLESIELFERIGTADAEDVCGCASQTIRSNRGVCDGELISVIVENRLAALYRYDAAQSKFKPACVFKRGVARG